MIYILTGKIRSGKTSALLKWIRDKQNVDGLLCPDNENGKRYFLNIKTKEEFEFEVESDSEAMEENEEIISIGNFKFLKSAFKEANKFLMSIASETENKYLIIDEIGKLELKNLGLHTATEKLIPFYETKETQHLILVIRDYLLEDVITLYSISEYTILSNDDLELLS